MKLPPISKLPLPDTLTFERRWLQYIPTPGLPCDGVLTMGQQDRKSGTLDVTTYGIQEVPCVHGAGRSWAVVKFGTDDLYTTSVLPRVSVCTCKAGKCRNEVCRHRDGLKALVEAGVLRSTQSIGA